MNINDSDFDYYRFIDEDGLTIAVLDLCGCQATLVYRSTTERQHERDSKFRRGEAFVVKRKYDLADPKSLPKITAQLNTLLGKFLI